MRVVVVVNFDAYAACLQLPIETGRTLICAEFLEKKFDSLPEVGKKTWMSRIISQKSDKCFSLITDAFLQSLAKLHLSE